MIDPILLEEILRSERQNRYQQYENYLNELDNPTDKSASAPVGKIQGKKVKQITTNDSSVSDVFNTFKKNNTNSVRAN